MNRIRMGAILTIWIGALYTVIGLIYGDTFRDFGIGSAVAMTGLLIHGLVDFIEDREREQEHRERTR